MHLVCFLLPSVFSPVATSKADPHQYDSVLTGNQAADKFVAGFIAGSCATIVLHPLDLVKTKLQVRTKALPKEGKYPLLTFAKDIKRAAGWRGLYRGFTANLSASALAFSTYLGFYEFLKVWLRQDGHELNAVKYFVAAGMASALTVFICNPLWLVKTRLFLIDETPAKLGGTAKCLAEVGRREGVRGLYRGLTPGLIGTSHQAVHLLTYEQLKMRFDNHSAITYLVMAAAARIVASVVTYPYQVVRSRSQQKGETASAGAIVARTWRQEGYRGFFRGIVPFILHVLPATCITWTLSEKLSQAFQK